MTTFRAYSYIALLVILSCFSSIVFANDKELEKVDLRLLWKHQFQFAGYYIAKEKGYYARQGLDVVLHEFSPDTPNMQSVLNGQTDFAIGRSSILIDKQRGNDIVALFAAFQSSPFMLLTKAFTGINRPEDLKGRRIMMTNEAERSGELLAMLAKAGLTSNDYTHQNHSFNIDDLINNKTDAIASYVSNEPYKLVQQGIPYNILHPEDYGFKMYSDILYTSGDKIRNSPDLVQKFYRASIEGWKYAFANIPETVSLIFNKYNSQNKPRETLLFEAQELKRRAFDERGNFGTLLPHRFHSMAHVYLITGAIQEDVDLEGFIYRPPGKRLDLTYNERAYIKSTKTISVCVQNDWPPYERIIEQEYQGIIADLLKIVRDITGLSMEFIATDSSDQALTLTEQGVCDITTIAQKAGEKRGGLLLSEPFINITLIYLTAQQNLTLEQITSKVALSDHQTCQHCIDKNIPNDNRVPVDNIETAFRYLKKGQVKSLFGSEAHIRYLLSKNKITDLYIDNSNSINSEFSFAMNELRPELHGILDKSIDLFTQQQRDRILSRWVVSAPDDEFNQSLYWLIIATFLSITLFTFYRYYIESVRNRIYKELSETDHLTGIPNRRKMINEMKSYLNISNRYGNKISLIYFDIDDFKIINDQFGHETGDRILIELTRVIQSNIRNTDILSRWGGEEFVILNPESSAEESKNFTSNLRNKIHQHDFKLDRKVTCSFGITEYQAGESIDYFIHRADSAMYEAKSAGKDCIIEL